MSRRTDSNPNGRRNSRPIREIRKDIRGVRRADLQRFDPVVHLAALSNDPLDNLNERLTYDLNHHASVRLAKLAKEAGPDI